MICPTSNDIGRAVVYTGNYNGPLEDGVITSFNDHAVFVRYKDSQTSKATSRNDLIWLAFGGRDP